MIDKKLLAKIRKCMALSASDNEHEAAAALARARALMDEHGVTDEQIYFADVEEATARASRTVRPPLWEDFLYIAVCHALGVQGFINEDGDRVFIGRGPSAEIATYAFAVLFRQLKRARKDYVAKQLRRCKPGRKRLRADIFCQGWARAVLTKIKALMPASPKDEGLGAYLSEFYPGLVPVNSRKAEIKGGGAANDYWRGHSQGNTVDLHAGVNGASAPLAIS